MHTPTASPSMRGVTCLPHALTDSEDDDFVSVGGSEAAVFVAGGHPHTSQPAPDIAPGTAVRGGSSPAQAGDCGSSGAGSTLTAVVEAAKSSVNSIAEGTCVEAHSIDPTQPPGTHPPSVDGGVDHRDAAPVNHDKEQRRCAAKTASIRAAGKRSSDDVGPAPPFFHKGTACAPATPRQSPPPTGAVAGNPRADCSGTHTTTPTHPSDAGVDELQQQGSPLMPLPAAMEACVVTPILQQYRAVSAACLSVIRHRLQLPAHLALLSRVCLGRDCDVLPLLARELGGHSRTAVLTQRDVDNALDAAMRASCIAEEPLLPRLRLLLKGVVGGGAPGGALGVVYDCQWPLTCIFDTVRVVGFVTCFVGFWLFWYMVEVFSGKTVTTCPCM